MEEKFSSIEVNLSEGKIFISGTEAFIEKNMQTIFSFVQQNRIHSPIGKTDEYREIQQIEKKEQIITGKEQEKLDKYVINGVYHIDDEDGTISILKTVPGNTKAEKMKNIALIVLHIRKQKIEGREIIPICEKHNCYDASNFSSVFKKEKTNIIRKGNGQKWTLELTQPGEKEAIELLEEMVNGKK